VSKPSEGEQRLERLLNRTLRELPLRRAPLTLESRVLAELQRRAALPWWRHSFARWPRIAQGAFTLLCAALVGLAFPVGAWVVAGLGSVHESRVLSMPWARQTLAVMGAAGDLSASLARALPPAWVYDGLALSAVLYAALFGLAIAAYRTLSLNSSTAGELP
jgi:hypothetical protein